MYFYSETCRIVECTVQSELSKRSDVFQCSHVEVAQCKWFSVSKLSQQRPP